jgi:hypothetical protein
MSKEDRVNLNFLLTASAETLLEWYKSADEDDLEYADELLQAHGRVLDAARVLH